MINFPQLNVNASWPVALFTRRGKNINKCNFHGEIFSFFMYKCCPFMNDCLELFCVYSNYFFVLIQSVTKKMYRKKRRSSPSPEVNPNPEPTL